MTSPQPEMPSLCTSTRTIRRSVVRPKLVSKKCTSGIRISRSVIRSKRIPIVLISKCRIDSDFSKPMTASPRSNAARNCSLARCWISLARAGSLARMVAMSDGIAMRDLHWRLASNGWPARIAFTRGLRDPPFGDAAIGGQAAVQRAAGGPVLIGDVAANDGAQPLHIEKRVLDFERIESPLDQIDAARQRVVALRQLERCGPRPRCGNPAARPACGCADMFCRLV